MNLPIERKVQWGLGIAGAVLCCMVMVAYALFASFASTSNWVTQTRRVTASIWGARIGIGDAETSARGYLLTQGQTDLGPYNLVRGHIPGVMKRLVTMTSDDPVLHKEMAQLKLQADGEVELWRQMVEAARAPSVSPEVRRKLLDEDQQRMSTIRTALKEAHLHEEKLLTLRDAASRRDLMKLIVSATTLGLFNFVLLGSIYCVFKRDLGERNLAGAIAHQSQSRLVAILDGSPSIIFVKDTDGRYTLVNRRFEDSLRMKREQVLGKTDMDLFPLNTAHKLREHDAEALDARRPLEFEEAFPLRDGMHTYLSARVPLLGENNEPYALCGVFTDITARKRSEREIHRLNRSLQDRVIDHAVQLMQSADELKIERELRRGAEQQAQEAGARLHEVTHNSPVPRWTYDLEALGLLGSNNAAAELHGSRREELPHTAATDLYPLEEVSRMGKDARSGGVPPESSKT